MNEAKINEDMDKQELLDFLRTELPNLLRDDPDFRARLIGVLSEAMGTKAEFNALLQELREMRKESDKRFEQMDKRFQEMRSDFEKRFEQVDKRFDHVDLRLNEFSIAFGSLGARTGKALEDVIRQVIEQYSGIEKLKAERLVIKDTEGELYGTKGADVEFDAYVSNGKKFLVEVKSYTDQGDVLNFNRKALFAERKLGKVEKVIITPAIEKSALRKSKELGIEVHAFTIVD